MMWPWWVCHLHPKGSDVRESGCLSCQYRSRSAAVYDRSTTLLMILHSAVRFAMKSVVLGTVLAATSLYVRIYGEKLSY